MDDVTRLERIVIDAAHRTFRSLGRDSSRRCFKLALLGAFKGEALCTVADGAIREVYGDVEILHEPEFLVEDALIVDFRTMDDGLDDCCYVGLLKYQLQLAGKRHGVFLNLAGQEVSAVYQPSRPTMVPEGLAPWASISGLGWMFGTSSGPWSGSADHSAQACSRKSR